MNKNLQWIAKGKTGCTFATLFAKEPASVGWEFVSCYLWKFRQEYTKQIGNLVSITFPPDWNKEQVRRWALKNGFYEEETSEKTLGLRLKVDEGVSWVQYFGPDSHVVTRRAPEPMLIYCNKLNKSYYVKVGFQGILHLAHAWYEKISERVYDLLWKRSFEQTSKKLGHEPTVVEAAKTTWLK